MAFDRAAEAAVAVTIETDGGGFAFAEKGGRFEDMVELTVVAVGYDGKPRQRDSAALTLELSPEMHGLFMEMGGRLLSRLSLPPGRYQLRIGLREGSGALGTVHHDIEVPDFATTPLALSNLVLTSIGRNRIPTTRLDQFRDLVPVLPSTAREFPRDDELVVFAEVYNRRREPQTIDITTRVQDRSGRSVFQSKQERSHEDGPRFGHTARIRLAELPAGTYTLSVEAQSRLGGGIRASQSIPFAVR